MVDVGGEIQQSISCSDLEGDFIDELTVSVAPLYGSSFPFSARFFKSNEGHFWPSVEKRISSVSYSGQGYEQRDLIFSFPSPIDIRNDLCNGVDFVFFYVAPAVEFIEPGIPGAVNIFGSKNNSYINGNLWNEPVGYDAYFKISNTANSEPVLSIPTNFTVNEGEGAYIGMNVIDPDGDDVSLSATGLPVGATFSTSTSEFSWTPSYDDAGVYEVVFTATENTHEALFDTATVTITVNNVNRVPVMTPVGNKSVNEGSVLLFNVSATDPDGDNVTLAAANLPAGATFDTNTGTFTWNTDYNDAGNYTDIEFTAMDDGEPMMLDVELITITVGNVNRAPVFTNPGPQTVLETESVSFALSATDPDGDLITLSASGTQTGATFNTSTGQFDWTPDLAQAGVYTVTFVATDDGLPVETGIIDVVITVGDNPTPTEQAQYLIDDVVALGVPQNVENSYMANLHKVERFILDGKINPALNQLQAFVNKVGQDLQQGILTTEEHDNLLAAAENLITDLTTN